MAVNNSVKLIGRIGFIDSIKSFENGGQAIRLTLATNDKYKNKAGEKVERTEWHNITFFNKIAETIAKYAKQGTLIAVEGEIRSRKYQDDKGIERYFTEIIGDSFIFLDKKE